MVKKKSESEEKLNNIVEHTSIKSQLEKLGFSGDDINLDNAVNIALAQKALKGNVTAINQLKKQLNASKQAKEDKKTDISEDYSKLVDKEEKKLKKKITSLSTEEKEINKDLIHNVAFMSVTLKKLSEDIAINGVKERYQNGNNQWGYKDRVEVRTYNNMFKNYNQALKQLTDLVKKNGLQDSNDGFNDF